MKLKIFFTVIVVVSSIVLFSCQSSGTKEKKVATLESDNPDVEKLKGEIVEMIMSLPDNSETVKFINETGAAYVAGLTNEDLNTENILSRAESATAFGSILFDMAYANTYNQVNTFSKLIDINEALTKNLGFQELLNQQKDYQERYLDNKDNRDSVGHIVAELFTYSNEYLQQNGTVSDISLAFSGATIKSLFVISNVTLLALNNDKLVDLMKNQKDRLESNIKILELSGDDQAVKEMIDAIQPIFEIYSVTETFDLEAVEKIRELTSFIMQ